MGNVLVIAENSALHTRDTKTKKSQPPSRRNWKPKPPAYYRAMRHGLSAAKLPKGTEYITRIVGRFRQELEDAVIGLRGEIDIPAACAINTAVRWEVHSALASRWLRENMSKMSLQERLMFSREAAKACTERDRAVRALGLDVQDMTLPGVFYDSLAAVAHDAPDATPADDVSSSTATPPDATGGDVVAHAGDEQPSLFE